MRLLTVCFLVLVPLTLAAQPDFEATSVYLWGGFDVLNGHASGSANNPILHSTVSSSAGGFGGGFGMRFYLDKRTAIGIETGYLLTESLAESYPSAAYNEGILPILLTGQFRLVGTQGTSGMSLQAGAGIGILYRSTVENTYFGSSAAVENAGNGFLAFVGPQAEIAVADWLSFEGFVRYYATSLDNAAGKSMLYCSVGAALTF